MKSPIHAEISRRRKEVLGVWLLVGKGRHDEQAFTVISPYSKQVEPIRKKQKEIACVTGISCFIERCSVRGGVNVSMELIDN